MRHIFRFFFCYTFFQCTKVFSWNLLATYRYQELPVPQTSTLGRLKVAESVQPECTFKLTSQRTDIKNFSWSTCGQMISKEKYIFNFHFDWVRHKKKKKNPKQMQRVADQKYQAELQKFLESKTENIYTPKLNLVSLEITFP